MENQTTGKVNAQMLGYMKDSNTVPPPPGRGKYWEPDPQRQAKALHKRRRRQIRRLQENSSERV